METYNRNFTKKIALRNLFFILSFLFSSLLGSEGYSMKIREADPTYAACLAKWSHSGPINEYFSPTLKSDKKELLKYITKEPEREKERIRYMLSRIDGKIYISNLRTKSSFVSLIESFDGIKRSVNAFDTLDKKKIKAVMKDEYSFINKDCFLDLIASEGVLHDIDMLDKESIKKCHEIMIKIIEPIINEGEAIIDLSDQLKNQNVVDKWLLGRSVPYSSLGFDDIYQEELRLRKNAYTVFSRIDEEIVFLEDYIKKNEDETKVKLAIIALERIKVKRALIFCANEIYDDTGINYMTDLSRIKQNVLEMSVKYIYLMNAIMLLGANIKIFDNSDKRLFATIKPLQKLFSVCLEITNENKIKQKFKQGMPFLNACSLLQNLIDDIKRYPEKAEKRIKKFLDEVRDTSYPFVFGFFVDFMKEIEYARNMREIIGPETFGIDLFLESLLTVFEKKIHQLMNHILFYNQTLNRENKIGLINAYFPETCPGLKDIAQKLKYKIITTEMMYAEPQPIGFEKQEAKIFNKKDFKEAISFVLDTFLDINDPNNIWQKQYKLVKELKLIADKIEFADVKDRMRIVKIYKNPSFNQLMEEVFEGEKKSSSFGSPEESKIALMYVINAFKKHIPLFIKSIQAKKNQILKEASQAQSRTPHNNNLEGDNTNPELSLPATKSPLQIFFQKVRNYFSIDFGKKWQNFWKWALPSSNSV